MAAMQHTNSKQLNVTVVIIVLVFILLMAVVIVHYSLEAKKIDHEIEVIRQGGQP